MIYNDKGQGMKKDISLKLFLVVMWRGVCKVFGYIGRFFGFRKDTSFDRMIARVCSTSLTVIAVLIAIAALTSFVEEVAYPKWIRPYTSEVVFTDKHLSNHIVFQEMLYQDKGRVYNEVNDEVVLKDVDWVITSGDKDSLAVFCKNGRRGYLNRFTGEVVLSSIYSKAWVFSEGLAAVEKEGKLFFIDNKGKVVIDSGLEVYFNEPSYAFHNGFCVVKHPHSGKSGLIDRQGKWALNPEYDAILQVDGYWKVEKDNLYGLFSEKLDTLYAVEYPAIYLEEEIIEVRDRNHIAKRYDYEGNLVVDFVIDNIENMQYPTTELYHSEESDEYSSNNIYAIADCQKYMVRGGSYDEYFGLMDRNGTRITSPEYTSIEAVGKDLYLCQPQGIIINGKGERVE